MVKHKAMEDYSDLTLKEKLHIIQTELLVEKGRKNDFGGFTYKNLADILTNLKPFLRSTRCLFTLTDEIVQVGTFNYIKATATISHEINGETEEISVNAWARESVSKKGMDDAQITGATSSYARKYAANGLFAIDDTPDPDSMDNRDHKTIPQYNTKGTVETVPEHILHLKTLSRSPYFKGKKTKKGDSIQVTVNKWLDEKKRSKTEVLAYYTMLKDKEEGYKQQTKQAKEKASQN